MGGRPAQAWAPGLAEVGFADQPPLLGAKTSCKLPPSVVKSTSEERNIFGVRQYGGQAQRKGKQQPVQNEIKALTLSGKHGPILPQPVNSKLPDWFLYDLQIASNVHFPTTTDGYSLNWNTGDMTVNYMNGIKSFDFGQVTGIHLQLWIAGYTAKESEANYPTYAGPLDMRDLYARATNGPEDLGPLAPVLMFESNKIRFVPAVSVDLGNAIFIAFAPDQIIIRE